MIDLATLGWSSEYEIDEFEIKGLARITQIHRSHLRGITVKDGEINIHYASAGMEPLAVGDWISVTPLFVDGQGKAAALVKGLIKRKSKFARMAAGDNAKEQIIAANIDLVFIVTSINDDFNLNRLRRYLLLIKEGQVKPVIVLSKVDLKSSCSQIIKNLKEEVGEDILIIPTSVVNNEGVNKVKDLMQKGITSVFVGSSGVGKSSLVNAILNKNIQLVKEIREGDGKGRHTTTSRQMFFIPNKGMIIDTPGIRGVSVFGSKVYVSESFSEIKELIAKCKYSDCKHITEPNCAVIHALNSKELDDKRWRKYKDLLNETYANNTKLSRKAFLNSKKRRT